jgi:phage head maturation protease
VGVPSFWRKIFFGLPTEAQMTAQPPAARFSVDVPPEMLQGMTSGGSIAARISRNEALQVPALLRARNLICGSLGTLPLRVHGPDRRIVTDVQYLVPDPDPDIPRSVIMSYTVEDLLFEGIAWWQVTKFGWHGYPVEARHVPVGSVHVAQTGSLLPSAMQIGPDQSFPAAGGQVYIDGIPVPDNQIIRFDSPNPPLLRHAARAIRSCLKLDQAAALYADEPMPVGVLEPQADAEILPDEEIEELLDNWSLARSRHAWAYVKALKPTPLTWSPEQLQLADARQHAVLEVARATGVDPEDLGVSTTSRTYANQEQRWQALINLTLGTYVSAIQDRLSMRDVLPRGYVTRIDFAGFLRGDTQARMNAYKTGLEVGAYVDDEIRELEDRPTLTPAQKAARKPVAPPAPPQPPQREAPVMANGSEPVKFDADDSDTVRVQFDTPEVAETFSVDVERRTIQGLLVPWGKVARSGGMKWRFSPGSLTWSSEDRVKLNLDHMPGHASLIGRSTRLQSGSKGLVATFKIARGPEGDRALNLAQDKILDGLSAEVDFRTENGDSWDPDPSDSSVNLVSQGTLFAAALVANPAFDDARVTRVAASRDNEGTTMAAQTATPAAEQSPQFDINDHLAKFAEQTTKAHEALTAKLGDSIGDAISAGFKTALENLPMPQEGPQTVRAARFHVTYEPPVYPFSGMGNSLVRDAYYAATQRDDDALGRLRKYREQTEEIAKLAVAQLSTARFSTTTTTTASQIIPPGYRPDLYVSELLRGRPFVNALSRGTIDNATPFVVPVFVSSTGVSADHVEGTNPTDGSVSFTTKTVTPGAISGRLILTREIVDSSNPAIDQIALATMRESYARQTEAKVYTLLNGANGAGGTITSGLVPSGSQAATFVGTTGTPPALIAGIRARLAAYPFNRFGPPGVGLMGQNATSILATAVDTTGRPIFPSIGATNTSGVGRAVSQGWSVDGLDFIPAWAATGTAAGDTQIFILNPDDAWAWESPLLSFRYEEKSGPALIELNVFGYFGTHLLRPVGLSGIRIT